MKNTSYRSLLLTSLLISMAAVGCGSGDRHPEATPDQVHTDSVPAAAAPSAAPTVAPDGTEWHDRVLNDKNQPIDIRWNAAARAGGATGRYPDLVGIAVAFAAPSPKGEPGQTEIKDLLAIERRLQDTLTADGNSIYAIGFSGHGLRQFMFYTADTTVAMRRINAVKQSVTGHEIKVAVQHDPNWSIYTEWSTADTSAAARH